MTSHTANIRAHAAFLAAAALLSLQACSRPAAATPVEATTTPAQYISAASDIDAGRYLVKIGGCNDCHTPGYVEKLMMTGQAMPESDWLQGGDVGFAANPRQVMRAGHDAEAVVCLQRHLLLNYHPAIVSPAPRPPRCHVRPPALP